MRAFREAPKTLAVIEIISHFLCWEYHLSENTKLRETAETSGNTLFWRRTHRF